ncbi:unnamed protein product [Closterium sp. NIES-64]|nr:unnamed protein product [Closterium sp. NIES-64]
MPTLSVQTNVPGDNVVITDVMKDLSKVVARVLDRPEEYVMISVKTSIPMCFGGTEAPAAYAEVNAIDRLGPDTNKRLSAAISEILEAKLTVPPNRCYIKFYDVKAADFGWNGSTFDGLV